MIIIATILLTFVGIVAIYASSSIKAFQLYQAPAYFLYKQVGTALLGILVILFLQITPLKWLSRLTIPLFLGSFFLLTLIFLPNVYFEAGGATRWIRLGPISFQPAELAKLGLIFFIARYLTKKKLDVNDIRSAIGPGLLVTGGVCTLLLVQPDFGSAALISAVVIAMYFVRGLSRKYVYIAAVACGLLAALLILTKPYRVARIVSFINPWENAREGGFQIIQSYLAISNGHWLGLGFGESKQKLFYLPEAHTDFILAVIAEESGTLGILVVMALTGIIVQCGIYIALKIHDSFLRMLAFGISSLVMIQSSVNLGVVLGLLPTKGISFPYVSSGSSSLGVFLLLSGILARIGQELTTLDTHHHDGKKQSGRL